MRLEFDVAVLRVPDLHGPSDVPICLQRLIAEVARADVTGRLSIVDRQRATSAA